MPTRWARGVGPLMDGARGTRHRTEVTRRPLSQSDGAFEAKLLAASAKPCFCFPVGNLKANPEFVRFFFVVVEKSNKMGRYAKEPDNPAKSCKSRGSNLRVHFKVSLSGRGTFF